MPLPLRKRTVHFYDLHISSRSLASGVVNPGCASIKDLLECFAEIGSAKKLPMIVRKSSNLHTILVDWDYDKQTDCYELLLSKANAALSDVALRDLNTSSLRKANKKKHEGIELSAHVLIRPNLNQRSAAVLITMYAGVSILDVERLFRDFSRRAASLSKFRSMFYFDDPSGALAPDNTPMQYKVAYSFAAYSYKGQTLDNALKQGEFESLELISYDGEKFDAGGNLNIEERVLKIKAEIPKAVTGAAIINAVNGFIRSQPDENFNKLRIHFKTATGDSTSATMNVDELTEAFTYKQHIEFDTDIDAQQSKLNKIVLDKMLPLLLQVPK